MDDDKQRPGQDRESVPAAGRSDGQEVRGDDSSVDAGPSAARTSEERPAAGGWPGRRGWRNTLILMVVLVGVGWWIARRSPLVTSETRPTDVGKLDDAASSEQPDGAPRTRAATMEELLELAERSLERLRGEVDHYTARLVKQERVGGTLNPAETIEMKIQTRRRVDGQLTRPMRVYLHFIEPETMAGQEVIWDESLRDGKLVAHGAGVLNVMRLNLKPTGMLAMKGNRYPITEIGLTNLVQKLIERGQRDVGSGNATVTVTTGYELDGRAAQLIQIRHAEPTGEPNDFSLAEIVIDETRLIPLRYTAFGWGQDGQDPPLVESYTYLEVDLDADLGDDDFDPDNPNYDFP